MLGSFERSETWSGLAWPVLRYAYLREWPYQRIHTLLIGLTDARSPCGAPLIQRPHKLIHWPSLGELMDWGIK